MPNDTPSNLPVPVQPDRSLVGIQPFQPSTFQEVVELAKVLSQAQIIPSGLRGKPQDVAAIVLHGASIGIDAMAAIRCMHIIEGKPTLSADLMVGLVKRRPEVCEYLVLVESTDEIATYETKRRSDPKPVRMSFTIAQAVKAKLSTKDIWSKYPAAMLRARASSALVRAVYPDIAAGIYDPDELEPTRTVDVTPPPDEKPASEIGPDVLLAKVRMAKSAEDVAAMKGEIAAVRKANPDRSDEIRDAVKARLAALRTPEAPTEAAPAPAAPAAPFTAAESYTDIPL